MAVTSVYGDVTDTQGITAVYAAIDAGATFIDTADVYGNGANEQLIGGILASRRDEVTLASKFGIAGDPRDGQPDVRGDRDYIHAACDASLQRLGIDVIDLYYMHRRDLRVPIEETVAAMAELVAVGKVRHPGLSEVTGDKIAAASSVHPIAAVQSEWSLWSRDVEASVIPAAIKHGVGFVPYSPLGRGFLTGTVTSLSDNDFRRTIPRFADGNIDVNFAVVEAVQHVAREIGATAAQVSLAWVRYRASALGVASVPIPGTKSPARITENVASLALTLSDEQVAALDAAADSVVGSRSNYDNWVSEHRE